MIQKSLANVLEFQGVTFGYKHFPLFTDLSLHIQAGDRVAVVGPNGSGKSTLVRLALGVETAKVGQVKLFGQPVEWHRHFPTVGYIGDISHSNDGLGLPLWLTVRDAVMMYSTLLGKSLSGSFAADMLERLSVKYLFPHRIDALSAGERRKLMAYLALAKGPSLLVADEATEIIFEDDRPMLLQCVRNCCEQFGTAVLWISHDSDSTAQITETSYILKDGQLQLIPDPEYLVTIRSDSGVGVSEAMKQRFVLDRLRRTIKEEDFNTLTIALQRQARQESFLDER